MLSHWQILGLDPASATEKEAKIAYARLIKQHRPDTDPEGFQRVREAYEIGLAMIKQRPTTPKVAPQPIAETAPEISGSRDTTPEATIPPALAEAEAAVLACGDQASLAKAIGGLFYVCRHAQPGSAGIRLWQQSLHRVTYGRSDLVALGVSIPQLIAELEAGSSVVTHACIALWESSHDLEAIKRLGDAILVEASRVHESEAAIVALRLAMEIAFLWPDMAGRLTSFAFPHLDRETRDRVLPQIERQSQAGAVFQSFRDDQRVFWHRRLRRPSQDWRWNDPAADAAIEYLASSHEQNWEGYRYVRQVAPPEWCARLDAALQRAHGGGQAPAYTANLEPEQAPAKAAKARGVWLGLLGRLAIVFVLAGGCTLGGHYVFAFIKKQRIAAVMQMATTSNTGAPAAMPESATSSIMPAASLAGAKRTDETEGISACMQRSQQLRATAPSLDHWLELLVSMHSQAEPNFTHSKPTAATAKLEFRATVQSFFKSIALSESDPRIEPGVLELILLDPSVPEILKQEAIFRQQETQVLGNFLPCWQMIARTGDQPRQMIALAARYYLEKSGRLSCDASDRATLEGMAGNVRLPESAESMGNGSAIQPHVSSR